MNIKLKALMITTAILGGFFGFVYTMVFHPVVIMLGVVAVAFCGLYKLVLTDLTNKDLKKNGYSIKQFNDEYGGPR